MKSSIVPDEWDEPLDPPPPAPSLSTFPIPRITSPDSVTFSTVASTSTVVVVVISNILALGSVRAIIGNDRCLRLGLSS